MKEARRLLESEEFQVISKFSMALPKVRKTKRRIGEETDDSYSD